MYLPKSPLQLSIELTTRCNLDCPHCVAEANIGGRSLALDRVLSLVDEAQLIGVRMLDLGGGEPLLYDGFFDLCEYLLSKGLKLSFVTNGLLVPTGINLLRRIVRRYDGLLGVGVSLDGFSSEVHGYFRPKETFNSAVEALVMLREAGVKVSVSCVLNKENIKVIPEFLNFLSSLYISDVRFLPFMPLGRGARFKSEVLSPAEIYNFLQQKYLWNKIFQGNIGFQMPWEFLLVSPEKRQAGPCEAGYTRLWINSRGDVTPCAYMIDVVLGNIYQDSIADIWHDSLVLRKLRDPTLLKGPCATCTYRDGCRGGCRGLAYFLEGDYLCSDPYCPIVVQSKEMQA